MDQLCAASLDMAGYVALKPRKPLVSLYEASRLYINFFRRSFKLKSKTRHGAKVTKHYGAPLTPLERVVRSASVPEAVGTVDDYIKRPDGYRRYYIAQEDKSWEAAKVDLTSSSPSR